MRTVTVMLVVLISLGSAAVIRVPSRQPTVQAGLTAATAGARFVVER
jgi:hypothetical protein